MLLTGVLLEFRCFTKLALEFLRFRELALAFFVEALLALAFLQSWRWSFAVFRFFCVFLPLEMSQGAANVADNGHYNH